MFLINAFWKTILFLLLVVGLYYLPADIRGWSEAAQPWKRGVSMIDRELVLLILCVFLGGWLFWSELKPFLAIRLASKGGKPVRGNYPAEIAVDFANSMAVTKNFGVHRYYKYHSLKDLGTAAFFCRFPVTQGLTG